MRAFAQLMVLLSSFLPTSAKAEWVRLLPGTTEQVVANAGYAAVLSGGEAWLVRDDGTVLGRLTAGAARGAKRDPRTAQREAEAILDYLDVAEADRDQDWALDLLYDERTLAQRKRARAASTFHTDEADEPPALAAGAGIIWIASQAGLLRVGPSGEVTRQPGVHRGRPLLGTASGLLMGGPDGFHVVSMIDGQERALPVPPGGENVRVSPSGERWACTTGSGVAWASRTGESGRHAMDRPLRDLAYCGETLVILLDGVLLAVPAAGPLEVRKRSIVANRIVCPQGASGPWLAVGRGLQASSDEGRHWQTIETPPGSDINAVATTRHHLWLATSAGLFYSAEPGAAPAAPTHAHTSVEGPRRGRSSASWLSWLPQLSLRATAVAGSSGHEVEALAYATIPLDARRLPIMAVAVEEGAVPHLVPSRPSDMTPDPRDPDRHCLTVAKRKAVELAMSEPERALSYVNRAGHAAWLPELRILVSRRYGRSESLDIGTSSTALSSPLGIDTVNDIRYEARATWDLARLVFSAEELAAQNQAMHMAELRRDIESTVNRLYFERRRLSLDVGGADLALRHLRGHEITAELDSLTGGAFGTCTGDGNAGGP